MRRASLPSRLERLTHQRGSVALERAVRDLAAEYVVDPAEVRAELEAITARIRRYGPETPARVIARYAEELGLPETELWAAYGRITGASGDRV